MAPHSTKDKVQTPNLASITLCPQFPSCFLIYCTQPRSILHHSTAVDDSSCSHSKFMMLFLSGDLFLLLLNPTSNVTPLSSLPWLLRELSLWKPPIIMHAYILSDSLNEYDLYLPPSLRCEYFKGKGTQHKKRH